MKDLIQTRRYLLLSRLSLIFACICFAVALSSMWFTTFEAFGEAHLLGGSLLEAIGASAAYGVAGYLFLVLMKIFSKKLKPPPVPLTGKGVTT